MVSVVRAGFRNTMERRHVEARLGRTLQSGGMNIDSHFV